MLSAVSRDKFWKFLAQLKFLGDVGDNKRRWPALGRRAPGRSVGKNTRLTIRGKQISASFPANHV